jgi:hypothetical protein
MTHVLCQYDTTAGWGREFFVKRCKIQVAGYRLLCIVQEIWLHR